jgi:hypothetical protein
MKRLVAPVAPRLGAVRLGAIGLALCLSVAACTDPYDPGQRAVGGGLLGAGAGALIGGAAGGGRGAAAGALIGGALGAVGGAATTPPPPQPGYLPPGYAPPPPGYPPPPQYYQPPPPGY